MEIDFVPEFDGAQPKRKPPSFEWLMTIRSEAARMATDIVVSEADNPQVTERLQELFALYEAFLTDGSEGSRALLNPEPVKPPPGPKLVPFKGGR